MAMWWILSVPLSVKYRAWFRVLCIDWCEEMCMCACKPSAEALLCWMSSQTPFCIEGTNGISTWCPLITLKEAASLLDGFFRLSPRMTLGPLLSDNSEINCFCTGGVFGCHWWCQCERMQRGGGAWVLCAREACSQGLECLEENCKGWLCFLTLRGDTWVTAKLSALSWHRITVLLCVFINESQSQ